MNAARMLLRLREIEGSRPMLNDYRVYSAMLGLISRRDAGFSDYLHNLHVKAMNTALCGSSGKISDVEITSLSRKVSEDLYGCLSDAVAAGEHIWLGNATLKADAVIPVSPDAPSGNYGFFVLDENIEIRGKFGIEFLSPCVFKNGDVLVFFPDPWLVFNSLLKKWNFFSDNKIQAFSQMTVEQNLYVSGYDLKTTHIPNAMGEKKSFTGFIGRCGYEINRRAPRDFALAVNMLMRFAPFAGLGKSAAMGMGRVSVKF